MPDSPPEQLPLVRWLKQRIPWALMAMLTVAQYSIGAPSTPAPLGSFGRTETATLAKLPHQQVVEKLLAFGAVVWIKNAKGETVQVKAATETVKQKFIFYRVEFPAQRADETPLVAGDYALLDALSEVSELALAGPTVGNAELEKLRPFRALHFLQLDQAKPSTAGYAVLPTLPELHELNLRSTETTDEALKTVTQCRKLKNLHLASLPITDAGLANLPALTALEDLELNDLKITATGFAHLVECRALRGVYAGGFTIFSRMVEQLGACKKLESVIMPGSVLNDADIAPLAGLTKLRTLDLSTSPITGAAFASWPPRPTLTSLNLDNAAGVDDAGFKNIEHAFPKLESLDVKLAASGFTTAGAAVLRRLTNLHSLRLDGPGITDEVAAEFAHCDGLTTLAIPAAQISEPGLAALAHLTHLTDLSIDVPPVTDAALKSFGRCKALKNLNIGKDAVPDTELRIRGILPNLAIHRQEE